MPALESENAKQMLLICLYAVNFPLAIESEAYSQPSMENLQMKCLCVLLGSIFAFANLLRLSLQFFEVITFDNFIHFFLFAALVDFNA